jgi:hypothetical protein
MVDIHGHHDVRQISLSANLFFYEIVEHKDASMRCLCLCALLQQSSSPIKTSVDGRCPPAQIWAPAHIVIPIAAL